MRILLDTNITLRAINQDSGQHRATQQALQTLLGQGHEVVLVPQCLYESWSTMTRPPEVNGFGFSTSAAEAEVGELLRLFPLLTDPPTLFEVWLNLVVAHRVSGRPSHDARLAAAVKVHGLDALLTNNGEDFKRFGIQVLRPSDVLSGGPHP